MPSPKLFGRRESQAILRRALASPDPEFIAVYGRRRVGKTFLIREFFGAAISFELAGEAGASFRRQLRNFSDALGRAAGLGIPLREPATWSEAFGQLRDFLEARPPPSHPKRVLFLDELPWLDTARSGFRSALDHFWNHWGSRQEKLILIVCGSAASWMIRHLVEARGGFHNRLTRRIGLLPFSLGETEEYLRSRSIDLPRYQILELYMAMGGVPHYLKEAAPGESAAQIIDRGCFEPTGLLRDEFDHLFQSLFDNSQQHLAIVDTLARRREGLTRNELLAAVGLSSGGVATNLLEELERCGFILSFVPHRHRRKDAVYRLCDEFCHFHAQWIRKLGRRNPGSGHWQRERKSGAFRSWSGYAFESICLKHIAPIKKALGIANVSTEEGPWRFVAPKPKDGPGAQIDLLISRADQTINLCEMKYSEGRFTIDARYARELRRKLEVFQRQTGTRDALFLTMLTTHGVAPNRHAKELVHHSLTLDDLF